MGDALEVPQVIKQQVLQTLQFGLLLFFLCLFYFFRTMLFSLSPLLILTCSQSSLSIVLFKIKEIKINSKKYQYWLKKYYSMLVLSKNEFLQFPCFTKSLKTIL